MGMRSEGLKVNRDVQHHLQAAILTKLTVLFVHTIMSLPLLLAAVVETITLGSYWISIPPASSPLP